MPNESVTTATCWVDTSERRQKRLIREARKVSGYLDNILLYNKQQNFKVDIRGLRLLLLKLT